MSNLSITPQWNDEINQVEPGELISAGPNGNANLATRQLAENIWYLRDDLNSKINLKAGINSVYKKSEVYNKSETYSKIEVYTKNEADSRINSLSATTYAGHKGYATLAAAQAAQASLPANTLVEVTNDTTTANNGVYLWNGTTLTKSTYDPKTVAVADAKAYADSQDAANNIPVAAGENLLTVTPTGNIYPIVTDASGNVIFGYDSSKDELFGVGLARNIPQTSTDNTDVQQTIVYGQSLSIGQNSTAISLNQPYDNMTFSGGVKTNTGTIVPLVETTVETPCSAIANTATLFAMQKSGVSQKKTKIFASTAGVGGAPIDSLKKGTSYYTTMLQHVTNAKNLVTATGQTFSTNTHVYIQGEQDTGGITQAAYLAKLRQLASDVNTDIKSITGQSSNVPTLIHQVAINAATTDGKIQKAQLDAGTNNSSIYLVTPIYIMPHHSDKVHLTEVGYKWMGAYFGRAQYELVTKGIEPKRLLPISASIANATVTINFSVPDLPLALDTTTIPQTQDYGFAVKVDGVAATIQSVSVNSDKVTIVLASAPATSSVIKVRYALDYLATGLNIANGASGNLRDSNADTVYIHDGTKTLYHWCPAFELTATNGVI